MGQNKNPLPPERDSRGCTPGTEDFFTDILSAVPVHTGIHFLDPGFGQTTGHIGGAERLPPFFLQGVIDLSYNLLHRLFAVQDLFGAEAEQVSQGIELFRVCQLLQIS